VTSPDLGKSPAAWLAAFGQNDAAAGSGPGVALLEAPVGWTPSVAESGSSRIIFDGVLHNRVELRARFAGHLPNDPSDAGLVGQAYQCWGEDAVPRLKGVFALLIWDAVRELLLCARDPVGMHPLFYAEARRVLLFSPSIETLLAHHNVSAEIDRRYLVDRLTRRWLEREGTCFASVRRLPPGHVMLVSGTGRRAHRYWNPVPPGRSIGWIREDEARERFPMLLEHAVGRCLSSGPAGISLSGGLDSCAVAMVATDLCRREGRPLPWALSLEYPEVGRDDAKMQRDVAEALGVAHLQLPVEDASGPEGTLAAALELTRTTPVPVSTLWRPALMRLALHGWERDCRVILTGHGGDEWLWENPILVADFLSSGDLRGLYRVWRSYSQSYHFSHWDVLRLVLWRSGARYLVHDACRAAAFRVGAGRLVPRRWALPAGMRADLPPWMLPDPALRAQMVQRLEERYPSTGTVARRESYYARDTLRSLDTPDAWFVNEETFLLGRRVGVSIRHPFWDPDLIDLMVKVPLHLRSEGGHAKALVRRPLARRFPHLGFDAQRKTWLGDAFLTVVAGQVGKVRRAVGGIRTLAELGVVDGEQGRILLDDAISGRGPRWTLGWAWEILNLEAWARAHR
jgi:asparagine synthase (glutamine-hydrolysing)